MEILNIFPACVEFGTWLVASYRYDNALQLLSDDWRIRMHGLVVSFCDLRVASKLPVAPIR